MTEHTFRHPNRGAALVVGLVMLALITLLLVTALNLGTTSFRSVGNMQYRDEAIAAANKALEQVIGSDFTTAPAEDEIAVDIDNDGTDDYLVDVAEPQCVAATGANEPGVGPWQTIWDLDTTVTGSGNTGAAAARVHAGVRVLLSDAEKDAVCAGGGLPPPPESGPSELDDDTSLPPLMPAGPPVVDQPKAMTYWYIQK
jgi:hypothetical protein